MEASPSQLPRNLKRAKHEAFGDATRIEIPQLPASPVPQRTPKNLDAGHHVSTFRSHSATGSSSLSFLSTFGDVSGSTISVVINNHPNTCHETPDTCK